MVSSKNLNLGHFSMLKKSIGEEEKVFEKSLLVIEKDNSCKEYWKNLNHGMEILNTIMGRYSPRNEMEKVIKNTLLPRLLNSALVSLRLLSMGYYQYAFAVQRDLVEIQFLTDYFIIYPSKILKWRDCTNEERKKLFTPRILYQALDKRDGFINQKRRQDYELFSEYATHVTYKGAILLNKEGTILAGAFYDKNKLKNSLAELSRRVGHAMVSSLTHLKLKDSGLIKVYIKFMENYQDVFNVPKSQIIIPEKRIIIP